MSDFTEQPLKKLLNRENIFSRLERVERGRGARPSARVGQLGQLGQNTGNLIVDGSIVVVNRADGLADVTIDDRHILIRNQEGELAFQDTDGSEDTLSMYSDNDNFIVIANSYGGKGVSFLIDDAAHAVTQIDVHSDGITFNDTTSRLYYGSSTNTPMLDAGTYTPTLTNTTNVAASTAGTFQYIRALNIVSAAGFVAVDPTATGSTVLNITIPVASDFTNAGQANGVAVAQATNTAGQVSADTVQNEVQLTFQATDTANRTWRVQFMYQIL